MRIVDFDHLQKIFNIAPISRIPSWLTFTSNKGIWLVSPIRFHISSLDQFLDNNDICSIFSKVYIYPEKDRYMAQLYSVNHFTSVESVSAPNWAFLKHNSKTSMDIHTYFDPALRNRYDNSKLIMYDNYREALIHCAYLNEKQTRLEDNPLSMYISERKKFNTKYLAIKDALLRWSITI